MQTHAFAVRYHSNRPWSEVMKIAEDQIAMPHALRSRRFTFEDLWVEREEPVVGEPGVSMYHGTYRM